MTQGTASLLAACRDAGVERFVQLSALGTSEQTKDTVPYYRAKWAVEEAVRGSGLSHAILRPSFVFAGDGGALPELARIARLAPVTPVIGSGTQRLQPIWADDLARAVALAVRRRDDLLVELGGPDIVDWNELWSRLKAALGTRRPALHLPVWLMRPPATPARAPSRTLLSHGTSCACCSSATTSSRTEGPGSRHSASRDLLPLDEQLRRSVARPG